MPNHISFLFVFKLLSIRISKQIMIILFTWVLWAIWKRSLIIWMLCWDTFFTIYNLALYITNNTTHMHVLIFHRFTFVRCRNIFPTTNSLITNIQYFISSFLYFTSCYVYIYNDIADSLFIVSGIGIKLTYLFLIQVR